MKAMSFRRPLRSGQAMTSRANTFLRSSAQGTRQVRVEAVGGHLGSASVEELTLTHGAAGTLLGPRTLARLDRELASIPKPYPPDVADGLSAFRKLVALVRKGKGLRLLRSLH